ncbi:MAG: DUF481 domain-containing protein [Deltaproteobacteria bacterium]|nr:MAG: DUF481 domain-containing protein [Deltaproteobacteria bacterium]
MLTEINKNLALFVLLISQFVGAQNDTIQLKNNAFLVGEVKSFSQGILIIETDYSDKDFRVEFNKVKGLIIERKCLITLTNGRRRFGNIRTNAKGIVEITLDDGIMEYYKLHEIIALTEVDDKFWSRFTGSIELGFNLTKANNNTQFTIDGDLKYADEFWRSAGSINVLDSSQDDVENTKRTDVSLSLIRILPRKWYLLGEVSFLANTEQALDSRISPSIGAGKFLISTNTLYLGLSLGYAYNIENYVDASLDKTSSEIFIFSEFNMFDYKDIDLNTGIKLYPSLSENGRFRTDFDLTLKYDLLLDFYIKLGFALNFDNQPAIEGNDFDYIFTTGFGWKFD